MSKIIADALFPHITKTPAEFETKYPPRAAACTTRFAPSPTGFMHIGGLYTALLNCLVAREKDGVFLLRIEDTDQKRQVEGGVSEIISSLRDFDIRFDEGPANETEDYGGYGPYRQSLRREIYQTYARDLVERDLAYPCFCSEEELQALREQQEQAGEPQKGYFGKWAVWRDQPDERVLEKLQAGEPYVIRLKCDGKLGTFRTFHDELRGDISMQENILDFVIIKRDGLPTYHFAHVIDDHLMRTTDVIRADEWLSSLPVHVQMFETMGFPVPRYTHLSPIMKLEEKEGGSVSRRKLSKRKDPEARVRYYDEVGYPIAAVTDYLLTISSADYEPWRAEHMDEPVTAFPLDITKTGAAGALFDFNKLTSVARSRVAHMTQDEVFAAVSDWAARYQPALLEEIRRDEARFRASIDLWHENRMDVAKWSDLMEMYPYLYDRTYRIADEPVPEKFGNHRAFIPGILQAYLEGFDYGDDSSVWFEKLRTIATSFNYAAKTGPYKKHPENYNGSIADVSSFVRFALTGRLNTPDLHGIIHVLGEEEATARVRAFCERMHG